jgi:hypothetical protein
MAAALLAGLAVDVSADVVTDWNARTGEIIVESKIGTPPAVRVMAVVQTAVFHAVTAQPRDGVSIDAAVAAANRNTLAKLVPSQQPAIDAAYQAALAKIADGPAKVAGIAAGEKAAAAVLSTRAEDGAVTPAPYRPHAVPGVYVPTAAPAATQWPQRKPWLMSSASQFRPGPPPALTSAAWARDYNEIKALGSKNSVQRSAEQTEIARFWEFSLPSIYHGVARSVADMPKREPVQNARLLAAVAQAMDDAMIAVFEAKYHYNFWRPSTAIRNGDIDGNEATEREASWTPFIDEPMHPEYPSAHSILASAVGAVLQAEVGKGPMPALSTASPTARGAVRRWTSIDAFTQEVANARVYEGVHYRTSTEVGAAMGRKIGALAAAKVLVAEMSASAVAVPDALRPGRDETLAMVVPARGVQIYECRAAQNAAGDHAWTFVAPEADLFDTQGNRIGRHYAGPHWEASDGSKFVGKVKARADAPVAGAIPWLLLGAKPLAGTGTFANVTSIQRVNTSGGVAPSDGCSRATAGTSARVDYTADYVLFVAQ